MHLNDNNLNDTHADWIANALKINEGTLCGISIYCNNIGDDGLRALTAAIGENAASSLECLSVSVNNFRNGDRIGRELAALMRKEHVELTLLNIDGVDVDKAFARRFFSRTERMPFHGNTFYGCLFQTESCCALL